MALHIGDAGLDAAYIGDTELDAVYLGDSKLWPEFPPYSITKQPQDCIISAIGDYASFHIETNDPGATYQWRYQRPGSSSSSNTSLAGNKTDTLGPFTTNSTNAEVGRAYYCRVTFSNGTVVNSDSAYINIVP